MLLAMAVYRLAMLAAEAGPPGSDAGNWLAFSHELFGAKVKAAESMYFPVTLVLLKALMLFFSPLPALKLLAVVASLSIGVPFYLILRRACSPLVASALCLALLMAGYQIEMLSWGGYPQLLATAFMLTSLHLLDEGLRTGRRSTLVAGGAFAALVAGTHHFTLLILAATVAVYAGWAAWQRRRELREAARRFFAWAGAVTALSLLFLPWYARYLSIMADDGALNSNASELASLGSVFSYVYSEAPLTWLFLMAVVPVLSLAPGGGERASRLRPLGLAIVVATALTYAATREVRVFQPMQVGMLLCAGVLACRAEGALAQRRLAPSLRLVGRATYAMALTGLLLILVINGNLRFEDARGRFTALDANAREALDWVREGTPPDSTFLAGGRDAWVNYAWWVEGYGRRPTYGLINPSFLAFREEREQAEVARRLVDPATSAAEARELLSGTGIDYLFIYKPSGGSFQNLVEKVPVLLSHQNDDFVVLRVAPASSATAGP